MLCRWFKLQNSWGTGWGDNGYFYMRHEYLLNPKLNENDMWFFND